jgi:hypothetical protein
LGCRALGDTTEVKTVRIGFAGRIANALIWHIAMAMCMALRGPGE